MLNKSNNKGYPYAWLDEVIEITLNPEKTNVLNLEIQQLEFIESKFDIELQGVLNDLKISTFYLFSSKKIRSTVAHYYESLQMLEEQALNNLAGYPSDHPLTSTGENLIIYIQNTGNAFKKRYGKYLSETTLNAGRNSKTPIVISKIMCRLSVDQLGIILRAADESKLIVASSISLIFRSIVPYLSTPKVKNISWNSMRKSTYQIEQSDKEIAVAMLEKLIVKIKEY